jgi:hypothetical protein
MTVYYYEGSPIAAPFAIESGRLILSSSSASLKTFTRTMNSQRWEISFNIVANSGIEDVFVGMLDDQYTINTMVMPQLEASEKRTTATVDPTVATSGVAGESAVAMTSSEDGATIAKGSFVKFSTHDKLYMVTSDATTGAAFTLTIHPSLQRPVASGSSLSHPGSASKPVLSYRRDAGATTGVTFTDGVMVDQGSIRLVEAV